VAYYCFTVLLVGEVGLRWAAWGGWHSMVRDSLWSLLDALLAGGAAVGMALSLAGGAGRVLPGVYDYGLMRIALSLRVLRYFHLVRLLRKGAAPWLDVMQPTLRAARRAFPKAMEVFFLKGVVIFVYAIVGCAAFPNTRRSMAGDNMGGNPARSSGNLNHQANFETFPLAFFTLFRATTGENWNMIMLDMFVDGACLCLRKCCAGRPAHPPPSPSLSHPLPLPRLTPELIAPYCKKTSGSDNNCGNSNLSILFWVSFTAILTLVIDPLIAVVCYEAFWRDAEGLSKYLEWADPGGRRLYNFTHGAAEPFKDAWEEEDPFGKGVTRDQLERIVSRVPAPLGAKRPHSRKRVNLVELEEAADSAPQAQFGQAGEDPGGAAGRVAPPARGAAYAAEWLDSPPSIAKEKGPKITPALLPAEDAALADARRLVARLRLFTETGGAEDVIAGHYTAEQHRVAYHAALIALVLEANENYTPQLSVDK